MALLLVKIEDENSLAFNEFFDYNGVCYASTRSRINPDEKAIDMSCFYEATISTKSLSDVPVIFVTVGREEARILGWYQKAEIQSTMESVSLFLEGNVKAYAFDAIWLPKSEPEKKVRWFGKDKMYEVIEQEDVRFAPLQHMIDTYKGKNQMFRYHDARPMTHPKGLKDIPSCQAACEQWAALIMAEECHDISDIKTLEAYGKRLCDIDRKNPDGYYYQALASYHLGFVKDGLKLINKALQLEPDASDLAALKGMLLVSRGYGEEGASHLHEAYEKSHDEEYLLLEGRAYMIAGKVDKAYDCFGQIEDETLLENIDIKLKDMEKKWNFIKARGMKIKELFHKK